MLLASACIAWDDMEKPEHERWLTAVEAELSKRKG